MSRAKNNSRVVGYNTIICPNCQHDNGQFVGSFPEINVNCNHCGERLHVKIERVYVVTNDSVAKEVAANLEKLMPDMFGPA